MMKNLLYIFLVPIVIGLTALAISIAIGRALRKRDERRMYEVVKPKAKERHLHVVKGDKE